MDDLITTQEVARMAGVGPTAVKRWSESGLLRCIRTAGGHRRFVRAEVEKFLRRGGGESSPVEREPWVGALLEPGDPHAVEALLLSERARTGAWHQVAETAGQALHALGSLWSAGAVTILEEHLASERLARALARVGEAIPVAPTAPRALLMCAEGDDHALGLALVELVLREAGWATDWAGRRTPIEELRGALARGVRMLAVSASELSSDGAAMKRQAEELGRLSRAAGVALALGGSGAWPDRPRAGVRFRSLEPFHAFALAERARLAASSAPAERRES
jgi:MerR family transcriptional regulator, light-induced transcriptional regulator